jgi:hypothetical protein
MAKKKRAATKKKAGVRKKATKKKAAVKKKVASRKAASASSSTGKKKKVARKKPAQKATTEATDQPAVSEVTTKKKAVKKTPAKKKAAVRKKVTTKKKAVPKKKTAKPTRKPKPKTAPSTTTKPTASTKRKKATRKKAVRRKKSAGDRKAVSTDAAAVATTSISDDPRQMKLFENPDQLWTEREATAAIPPASAPAETQVVEQVSEESENAPVEITPEPQRPEPSATDPNVTSVTNYLEREGVLRTRVDPDTGQSVVQLYHDYLSRAVVEAERRADRWPTVIRDAQQQFDEAGSSFFRRWRALLSPWHQVRILIERFRSSSNFTYGPQRTLAVCSLLRFTPHIIVMLALILGWNAWKTENQRQAAETQRQLDRAEARKIMAVVNGTTEYPSTEEYRALDRLAECTDSVRLAFIEQLVEKEENAKSLKHRYEYIIHAVVAGRRDAR